MADKGFNPIHRDMDHLLVVARPVAVIIHNNRCMGTALVVSLVAAVMVHRPHHRHLVDTIIIIHMVVMLMCNLLRYVISSQTNQNKKRPRCQQFVAGHDTVF